jgi:hypothetical protein
MSTSSLSGNTLTSTSDINLSSPSNGTINFQNGTTTYGSFTNSFNNFNNSNGFTVSSSTYLTLSASTSNTSGYIQSFYFYSNGGTYYGPFLSISEDVKYDVSIFTQANNGSNLSPNLTITTIGSIYLNAGYNISGNSTSNTIYLQNNGATYGSFNNNGNTLNINTPNSAGYIELNASSGLATNYNSATLGTSNIINGNSLQNILGGLNSSRLGSLGGYNYMTSRYVSNTTGYALINQAPNNTVYGGPIYFTNIYNAIGGCYLVTTINSSFLNNGEVGVSLVIGTNNIYSLVNLYSPGYISIGVAGTDLGNGINPISGSGLFFYSSSLSVNTIISFTTMQIA